MAKRLILVAVILLACIAALPPVLGMVYERQIRAEFDAVPVNPLVNVSLAGYERGLYQSEGAFSFALTDEYLAGLRAAARNRPDGEPRSAEVQAAIEQLLETFAGELRVDFEVQHGPVVFADNAAVGLAFVRTTLSPASGSLAEFQARVNVPYLLQSDALVGFDGEVRFRGNAPPMADTDGDFGFEFSGLEFDGRYNMNTRALQLAFASETLRMEEAGQAFRVAGMAGQSDLSLLSQFIWLGDSQLTIREIGFLAPGNDIPMDVVVRNLGLSGNVRLNETGDRMAFSGDYSLDSLSGIPDADLADLRFGMRFSNFDVWAYEQLVQQAQAVDEAASPPARQAAMQQLAPLVVELLRGSPGLEITPMTLRWNGQPFDADLRLDFNAGTLSEAEFAMLTTNPALALAALSGNGRMAVSSTIAAQLLGSVLRDQLAESLPPDSQLTAEQIAQAAAAQAAMSIEALVQQGLLERSGELLKSEFNYRDGLLTVRGTAIPLGGM